METNIKIGLETENREHIEEPEPKAIYTDNNTCYIIIRCHGTINWGKIINIPFGKEIIKKNKSACGYISYGNPSVENQIDLLIPYFMDMKTNMCVTHYPTPRTIDDPRIDKINWKNTHQYIPEIDPIWMFQVHEKKTLKNIKENYPFMEVDPTAQLCQVMINKRKYHIKRYSIMDTYNSHDYGGIFICNINPDNSISKIYNIFFTDEMQELIHDYNLNVEIPNSLKTFEIKSRHKIAYTWLDTRILFNLFGLLPFTTFKILDLSCATVHKPGPFEKGIPKGDRLVNPIELAYDYSEANSIGYGKVNKKYTQRKQQKNKNMSKFKKGRFINNDGKILNPNIGV